MLLYKFGGKEYQTEFDINSYDFGARNYDPALGRWMNIDPVTHHSQSPYITFDGNPVFFADPSGADVVPTFSDGYMDHTSTTSTGAVELYGTYDGAFTRSSGTDYVNKSGELVYSSHKGEGNIRIVDEGFEGKNKDLEANSKPIYEDFQLVGTENEAFEYISSVLSNQGINLRAFGKVEKGRSQNEDEMYIDNVIIDPKYTNGKILFNHPSSYTFGILLATNNSYMFSSYNNLLSGISHEKFHLHEFNVGYRAMLRGNPFSGGSLYKRDAEIRAYNYQMNNEYWNNTTSKFKRGIKNSYKNYKY